MRLAALCLAAAAAGCASVGAIKAYDGPERPDDQVATLRTELQDEAFAVSDTEIVAVDGVNYKRPHYAAQMLPGTHWVGILSTVRLSSQKREQFCAFELNFESACTYRLFLPSYPSAALDAGPSGAWQVGSSMQLNVECADTSYATRVPLECSGRALCRSDSNCPQPGMRCVRDARFSFGACAGP